MFLAIAAFGEEIDNFLVDLGKAVSEFSDILFANVPRSSQILGIFNLRKCRVAF